MRAILVDPVQRTIALTEAHFDGRFVGDCFASYPRMAARFPNGDVLLTAPTDATEAFSIGGSKAVVGPALLVGRRNVFGEHALAGFSQSVFTEDFVMIPAAKHREEDRLAGERAEADSRCAPEVETIATTPGAGRLPGSGRVRDGAMVAPAEAFR
jgi:hypothetical protein